MKFIELALKRNALVLCGYTERDSRITFGIVVLMIQLVSVLCTSALFGLTAAYLAHLRQKNPYFWFFMGFIFGLLGLMILFLSYLQDNKAKAAESPPPLPQPYLEGPIDRYWYYLSAAHEQQGPMSFEALTQAWKRGEISLGSLVWHEELPEWKPLQELIKYK